MTARALILMMWCLILPGLASAQSGSGGRIERLIERSLSDEGRIVELTDFRGALSTRASFTQMTISDDLGVWLTITDAVLDWDFSALLGGALDITELSAARIEMSRPPVPPNVGLPPAQASGLRIPNIPVAIQIDQISVPDVRLGSPVLGEAIALSIDADASLTGDGLGFRFTSRRTDGAAGQFDVAADYTLATDALRVTTRLQEDAGGVIARLLNLPGAPSLRLTIAGEGPLDDFGADIDLSTDGAPRLSGRVGLSGRDGAARRFTAALAGDIRPLLTADNRAFFGPDTRLSAQGRAEPSGAMTLDALELTTAQMTLSGEGRLVASGAPERLKLTGALTSDSGVSLPGSDLRVAGADLSLDFDARQSDDWTLEALARGVTGPGMRIAALQLRGQGTLTPDRAVPLDGALDMSASGVSLQDPALAQALGPEVRLETRIGADETGAVSLQDLVLQTPHASLSGSATIAPENRQIQISVAAGLEAPDLSPLALPQAPVKAGALSADLTARAALPSGTLSLTLAGSSTGLDLGQPRLAPVLAAQTDLTLSLRRDVEGTFVDAFSLTNDHVTATGTAAVSGQSADVNLRAELADISVIEPSLPGPASLTLNGTGAPEQGTFDGTFTALTPYARLDGTAGVTSEAGVTRLNLRSDLDANDLAPFATLAAPLRGGALTARIAAESTFPAGDMRLTVEGQSRGLDIGSAQAAPFLAPQTRLLARLARSGDVTRIEQLDLANTAITASASGQLTAQEAVMEVSAQLSDLGVVVEDLTGPVDVSSRITADPASQRASAAFTAQTGFAETTGSARYWPSGAGSRFEVLAALVAGDLSALSKLAAPLRGGAVRGNLQAAGTLPDGEIAVTFNGVSRDIDIGQPMARPLITLPTTLEAEVTRTADGALSIRSARLENAGISARATGRIDGPGSALSLRARIADLARVVPALPGAVNLAADVRELLGSPGISATITGANGIDARVSGQVGLPGGAVDLQSSGQFPLALAQKFVAPRVVSGAGVFDVSLTGAPALENVSGNVTTRAARLADPELGLVLSPVDGRVDLARGRGQIDVLARMNGGSVRVGGDVAMTPPFRTALAVDLAAVPVRYQDILKTTLSGQVSVEGPATQSLAIGGDIRVSDTEIRIPDSGAGAAASIPEIRHIGASPQVQRTLGRAGLLARGGSQSAGSGPRLPLDLTLSTRTPVFVRGRGLDAEFFGQVRLGGTAVQPVPVGEVALRRGRLAFLGRRLDLTEGAITLAGSLMPRIRILAEAVTPDVTANVTLEGPADAPELRLGSVPDLPEDETLSRLLFGKSITSLSPFQIARLISSVAQLAGRGGPGLLDQTRSLLGFDDLDIRTDARTGEAELAIGRYVDENIYSEVEVGARGEAQINLNLDLNASTRLRGSVRSYGETGLGIFWQKDY